MRAAMTEADVGDDVFGEDPTVIRLEQKAAILLGTQAALFTSSGTQSNLLALLSHCERGDEYIVGQTAHTYKYEGGGGAVVGSIQPQPLDFMADGTLDLEQVSQVIKPDNFHFARTRLLCLENTHNGLSLPFSYLRKTSQLARKKGLKLHLDGARLWNASVQQNVSSQEIGHHFDSISVCLSKGLGAPVGSLLCSTTETIKKARRWRKVLGGGMRQAGILAAAGLFALDNHINRLEQDHANSALLAKGLSEIDELVVSYPANQTNMVFVDIPTAHISTIESYLRDQNILIIGGTKTIRLVTHMDVDTNDIHRVIETVKTFFSNRGSM